MNILYIILLISNFSFVNCFKNYTISSSSIFNFEYYNDNKYPISIYLNNARYRESSIQPFSKGIFSIGVNPGFYKINSDTKHLNVTVEKGKILKSKGNLKNKVLTSKKDIELGFIEYFEKKDNVIKISSMINFIKYNPGLGSITINIFFDGKNILNKILDTNKHSVFSFKSDEIYSKKGYHQIYLYAKSNDDIYCSCPEIYNGFSNGRHFTSWIIDRNNDNQKIVIKIPKKNKVINHNVISISKMLNDNYYNIKSNIFFSSKY
jgi:hypothetical protein